MTRRARLYTEMVTTGAILHGPRDRLLACPAPAPRGGGPRGGAPPPAAGRSARLCADLGYDEVNLNVGCPSDRVRNGRFGACLMLEPALVADCVAAMKGAVAVPVTVKCRIGVDDQEPRAALPAMAEAVRAAGADALTVHARKAWLRGLSPKQNRDVPPLDYPLVHRLKRERPDRMIAINGGLGDIDAAMAHLAHVDGVMLGRAAYQDPAVLIEVDPRLFGEPAAVADAFEAVERFMPYMAARLGEGVRLHDMTRHLLGLFAGLPGARAWRRHLATEAPKPGAGLDVVRAALILVREGAARVDEAA